MARFRHLIHNLIIDFRRFINLFQKLDRDAVGGQYLKGSGIEIGALHNPFRVPGGVKVSYVDRMPVAELRKQYPELAGYNLNEVDIIDDGERLATLQDGTQDFVIANHFIEHCEDPLGAMENMMRVLKKEGVLLMCVPDKRYTFDSDRPVTTFDHLVKDFTEGPAWSRDAHYEEWARCVEHISGGEEVRARASELAAAKYSIHYHVWSEMELLELVYKAKTQMDIPLELELLLKNNGEVVLILSKTR